MTEKREETGKKQCFEQEGFSREDKEFLETIRELPEDVKTPSNFHDTVMETIRQREWVKNEETRREQNDTTQER